MIKHGAFSFYYVQAVKLAELFWTPTVNLTSNPLLEHTLMH